MSSLPTTFVFGSASSSQGVRDALASYRRSQYFIAGSTVPSSSNLSDTEADEESGFIESEEDIVEEADSRPVLQHYSVDEFLWDDMLPEVHRDREQQQRDPDQNTPHSPQLNAFATRSPHFHERSPLLRKVVSFSSVPRPHRRSSANAEPSMVPNRPDILQSQTQPTLLRRTSTLSNSSTRDYVYSGKSTFGQTLFNSIAILLGIGMLSEPLAFAYAGWIGGNILIIFYGYVTCYTAKLLAHIILSDPRLRSYSDIGRKAFGPRSTSFISVMFCLEIFAVSVVLVTLYADSLHAIAPAYSINAYKLWGLVIIIPTVFLPLSLLSYTSILSILSTLLVIAVIFIDGLSKAEKPGSLWSPADTTYGIQSLGKLGVAFGLFMAGFAGHAVIPSLARDMVNPQEFDKMINWAFIIATVVYTMIGYAGYLMFGRSVSDEVSRDLLATPGYNPFLNEIALWLLVVTPITKYALATRPVNITLEIIFGLESESSNISGEDISSKVTRQLVVSQHYGLCLKNILFVVERVTFPILSVAVSILVPEFSSAMAFLGSFSAFMLCVIGPISAKVALAGRCEPFDAFLLITGFVMATWGTFAAFWAK